jgi:hypothetical protein
MLKSVLIPISYDPPQLLTHTSTICLTLSSSLLSMVVVSVKSENLRYHTDTQSSSWDRENWISSGIIF